jgi:hypothetical protein
LNFLSASSRGRAGQGLVHHVVERRAVDEVERVDDVALHLAHLVAGLVDDEAVEQHALEGGLSHEVDAHHHHAGDPEEEDVVARLEIARGVELLEEVVLSGQPSVENGHSADENQVSSTSSSCFGLRRAAPPQATSFSSIGDGDVPHASQ